VTNTMPTATMVVAREAVSVVVNDDILRLITCPPLHHISIVRMQLPKIQSGSNQTLKDPEVRFVWGGKWVDLEKHS
jgi:hypothetical protein